MKFKNYTIWPEKQCFDFTCSVNNESHLLKHNEHIFHAMRRTVFIEQNEQLDPLQILLLNSLIYVSKSHRNSIWNIRHIYFRCKRGSVANVHNNICLMILCCEETSICFTGTKKC